VFTAYVLAASVAWAAFYLLPLVRLGPDDDLPPFWPHLALSLLKGAAFPIALPMLLFGRRS